MLTFLRPTGGATATKPANWDSADLGVYFTRVPTFTARAATRTIPSSTANPSNTGTSKKSHVGAIAGGVVGGLVGLIIILSLILFCLHRRKKALKSKEDKGKTPTPPPAELAATSPVQELASPGTAKYISMNQPDPNLHPAYSGPNSLHSRSPSNEQGSPYPYQSTSPTTAPPFPSPYNSEFPHQNFQQNGYASYNDNPNAYDTQNYDPNVYPALLATSPQRQYSYPSPHSPPHPPFAPLQQTQIYYPPPPEPSSHSRSRSHPSFSDRMGSPEGTQYSGDTENGHIPPSTTNTPAQFYAQPAPPNGHHTGNGSAGHSPGGYGGEGGSTRDDRSPGGSLDSRRRPVRGRFVEVDHM